MNNVSNADPLGEALCEYFFKNKKNLNISVFSSISEEDFIPVQYLFRTYNEMPEIEKIALNSCFGRVLDVGCGSGIHSLYLQSKGINVKSIDISKGAIEVCKAQNLDAEQLDFYTLREEKFDSLLFLMNGIGIAGEINNLATFFKQCKALLNPGGQVLLDSSDIIYMYEESDGSYQINLNDSYYGEVEYITKYKNALSNPFKWLFIDFANLSSHAEQNGFKCELVVEGTHYDFLAKLTPSEFCL